MKTKIIGIFVLILFTTSSCMMMSPMHTNRSMHINNHYHQNDGIYIDHVCGTEVSVNDAVSYNYSDNMYYFDSDECMSVFQKNPDRFIIENNGNKNKLR